MFSLPGAGVSPVEGPYHLFTSTFAMQMAGAYCQYYLISDWALNRGDCRVTGTNPGSCPRQLYPVASLVPKELKTPEW